MGGGNLSGRGRLTVKSGFLERKNMSHRFWIRNSETAFGFRKLTRKSRGNPQFPTETMIGADRLYCWSDD